MLLIYDLPQMGAASLQAAFYVRRMSPEILVFYVSPIPK